MLQVPRTLCYSQWWFGHLRGFCRLQRFGRLRWYYRRCRMSRRPRKPGVAVRSKATKSKARQKAKK